MKIHNKGKLKLAQPERKKPRKGIHKINKRLLEFYNRAPEGITVLDSSTLKFIDYNHNALKLLKFSGDEIIKQGPITISPEFQPGGERSEEKAMKLIDRALNGEKPVFEWLVKTGAGDMRIFEVRLALLSPQRGVARVYASFIDIMKRKLAEAKIILQNKKLAEIAYLQSHQVRQPISTILGLVKLFNLSDMTDPFNAEVIVKLEETTKKFDSVIKNIVNQTTEVEGLIFKCRQDKSCLCHDSTEYPPADHCFVTQGKNLSDDEVNGGASSQ